MKNEVLRKLTAISCNIIDIKSRMENVREQLQQIKVETYQEREMILKVKKIVISCTEQLLLLDGYTTDLEIEMKRSAVAEGGNCKKRMISGNK